MHLHLTVLQDNVPEGENPTQAHLWNPQRTEFRWNADFSAFYPIRLRWWDDASYIRYQAGDDVGEEECRCYDNPNSSEEPCIVCQGRQEGETLPPPTVHDTIPAPPLEYDPIPF